MNLILSSFSFFSFFLKTKFFSSSVLLLPRGQISEERARHCEPRWDIRLFPDKIDSSLFVSSAHILKLIPSMGFPVAAHGACTCSVKQKTHVSRVVCVSSPKHLYKEIHLSFGSTHFSSSSSAWGKYLFNFLRAPELCSSWCPTAVADGQSGQPLTGTGLRAPGRDSGSSVGIQQNIQQNSRNQTASLK